MLSLQSTYYYNGGNYASHINISKSNTITI